MNKIKLILKRFAVFVLTLLITFTSMNFNGISFISNVVDTYANAYDHYFPNAGKNTCGSGKCSGGFEIHCSAKGTAGCIGPYISAGQTVSFVGTIVGYGHWSDVRVIITNSSGTAAHGGDIGVSQTIGTISVAGNNVAQNINISGTASCSGWIALIGYHDNDTNGENRYVRFTSATPSIHTHNQNYWTTTTAANCTQAAYGYWSCSDHHGTNARYDYNYNYPARGHSYESNQNPKII